MDKYCIVSKKKLISVYVLFFLSFLCMCSSYFLQIFVIPCVLFLASAMYISLVHLRCSNCGALLRHSWRYCSSCGAMIEYK